VNTMGDLGFWALAHEHPDKLALVAPDGAELTAGQLLGRTNQVVHGLRSLGLRPGDVVATLLPNGVEMFELYLAALQSGWYLVPINHHLVGPEVAYILKDSEAKAFVAHQRFAGVATEAADQAGGQKDIARQPLRLFGGQFGQGQAGGGEGVVTGDHVVIVERDKAIADAPFDILGRHFAQIAIQWLDAA